MPFMLITFERGHLRSSYLVGRWGVRPFDLIPGRIKRYRNETMDYIGGIWAAAALIFCHGGHILSLSHLNDLLVIDFYCSKIRPEAEMGLTWRHVAEPT
jgi:hypothetical protein